MDKEMPRCDGFEATQRIRSMGFRGLILGVTGNAIASDTSEYLDRGADAVILKPVSIGVVVDRIRQFVEQGGCESSRSSLSCTRLVRTGCVPT
jgi:DNA-binding response OmpR family regulator